MIEMIEIIEREGPSETIELDGLKAAVQEMGAYHAYRAEYVVDGRAAHLEALFSAADEAFTYHSAALYDAATGQALGIVIEWDEERAVQR
jgi:hypothetical protein